MALLSEGTGTIIDYCILVIGGGGRGPYGLLVLGCDLVSSSKFWL